MVSDLHKRIARALGWTEDSVRSFTLQALRELVRGDHPKLAHEIDLTIQKGSVVIRRADTDEPEFDLVRDKHHPGNTVAFDHRAGGRRFMDPEPLGDEEEEP